MKAPAGIPASQLRNVQRDLLTSLIDEYVGDLHPAVARSYRERISRTAWRPCTSPGWVQSEPGKPVYYRIHGPGLLIEYDNSLAAGTDARFNDPNHIHTILRVPGNDFGDDWLRKHHQNAHH